MSCIVQKFGGTSVATMDRIRGVADIVAKSKHNYKNIVVVVSAMAGVTNKFIEYANDLKAFEGNPEYDSVVSSGELVTSGLVAIALNAVGIKSRSYASWQVPIRTNNQYGRAEIQNIDPTNLYRDLENDIVPVVSGFQGVSLDYRITTLGRGGSDLTAVALAAAIKADICEIYSDVDGVYTVDPNLYDYANRINKIRYNEMLEMASHGAKVLQEQSVAYAMQKNIVVRVASSFVDTGGTIISSDAPIKQFCGIAVMHNLSQIKVIYREKSNFFDLIGILEKNIIQAEIFRNGNRSKANIMVDKKYTHKVIDILKQVDFIDSVKQEISSKHFSKLSIIGSSITEDISLDLVKELKKHKIDSFGHSSKEHRSNLIISSSQLHGAISVLHKYCELDK